MKKIVLNIPPRTRLTVWIPVLFASLMLLVCGCEMLVDRNPVGKLAKVSHAEAVWSIQSWCSQTNGQIIDLPILKIRTSFWGSSLPVGPVVKVEKVTESGLSYSIAKPVVDNVHTAWSTGSQLATEFQYHMSTSSTGEIRFQEVHRIELFINPLGSGWNYVALYDVHNRRMIKFISQGNGRLFEKQARATRALAAAFLSFCPNVR